MNYQEFLMKSDAELRGRKVRTLKELRNTHCAIPAGTVCTITRKGSGFNIQGEPCPECRVRVCISGVNPLDVELLPAEEVK